MFDRRLLVLVPNAKGPIALSVVFQWAALVCNIGFVMALCYAVSAVSEGSVRVATVCGVAFVCLTAILLRGLFLRASSIQSYRSSAEAKRILRELVYGKLLKLGPAYREKMGSASVLQVSVEGVNQLESYFGAYLPQLFYSVLAPITLFVVLAPLSFSAAIALLACVPLIPVSIALVQTVAKKLLKEYWGRYETLGDTFLENLQGLVTLKIYQADEMKQKEMEEESERFRKVTMRVLTMQLNSITVMDIIAYGGTAVGLAMALAGCVNGSLDIAGGLAILLLSAEFFLPMRKLGSFFHVAMGGMAAADRMFELLGLEEHDGDGGPVEPQNCEIVAKSLFYSYDGKRDAVKNADFVIPQGAYVAFVGESGSGKSTVAKLLSGQMSSYGGSLSVSGKELKHAEASSLLNEFTVVTHESHLFAGSVRSNLLMADPFADEETLWSALSDVKLEGLVHEMGGLDARISEGGGNLSGGQRQRLAMARAIVSRPSVYIFDEATSNIDPESEAILASRMKDLSPSSTVIVVSHRLASVENADRIFVMDGGTIVESGTHEGLLATDGVYAKLVKTQASLERWVKTDLSSGGEREEAVSSESLPSERTVQNESDNPLGSVAVMRKLVALVKPLAPCMALAVFLGVLGFAASTAILVLGAIGLEGASRGVFPVALAAAMVVCAVSRGFLRYGEQTCNHYIAFKILAIVRSKVFAQLRKLAPAKMEGRGKGDLVSVITSDVELLEVFYAHTVSPALIAAVMSLATSAFIAVFSPVLGLYALVAYFAIGVALPAFVTRVGADNGLLLRNETGAFSSLYLDSLKGLRETLQFGDGERRASLLSDAGRNLERIEERMKRQAATFFALTDSLVMAFGAGMFAFAFALHSLESVTFWGAVVCGVTMMSSFGPVVALANLGSTLQQTVACGNRVLSLLEESPAVKEREVGELVAGGTVEADGVGFSYGTIRVLSNVSLKAEEGSFVCVKGRSGAGKSTLLRLLMRFWDPSEGCVLAGGVDLRDAKTASLRNAQSFMTQTTHLFSGTLEENVRIARADASLAEVMRACEQAGLGEVIARLPEGLGTRLGEEGVGLSGGERQRMGLARAFLHDAPILILDEPTSNLDALNEARILESIDGLRGEKTVVLVSHRPSTAALADRSISVEWGRES